jgi:hypothetical protein
MSQQVAVRPTQKYEYFERNSKVNTWTLSGQGTQSTTVSGAKFAIAPSFGQTVILQSFNQFVFALGHIKMGRQALRLAKPITVNATLQDNMYSCRNEDLGIVSVSAKLKDCVKDFEEEIVFLWNEYGKENDARLTNDAKELKRKILNYIGQESDYNR